MGNIVIVGLGDLRTLFGACEQFVGGLWNIFSGSNDRRLLWNGTLHLGAQLYTCILKFTEKKSINVTFACTRILGNNISEN